jgi:hypothetical protein
MLTLERWDRGKWMVVATFSHETPLGEVLAALDTTRHNYRLACTAGGKPGWYTNLHICAKSGQ